MALPATVRQEPLNPSAYGIAIGITPRDPNFPIELQRAPDNGSGSPNVGAAVTLATLDPVSLSGTTYYDRSLKNDGAFRHYRWRHAATPGYDASPHWTPWARGIPVSLDGKGTQASTIFPLSPMASMAGQLRTLSHLVSTPELLPSAEFDLWAGDGPLDWSVDTGDSSSCARDAGVVFSGDYAAKYSFGAGGAAGTYRGLTSNDRVKGAFCMPLRPGVPYRIKVATRTSAFGAGEAYRLVLTFNAAATLQTTQVFAFAAATTWQVDTFSFVVPPTAEPNSRLAIEFTRGNTTAHDFWVDSLRVVEDIPTSDLVNQLASTGQDFILNGGFEQGFAYWRKRTGSDTNPVIETGTPYVGAKAFKSTGGATAGCHLYMCDRQSDPNGADPAILQGNDVYVKVQPLDEIHVSAALKTSAAAQALAAVTIDEYDANKGFIQTTNIVTLLNTTAWTVLTGGVVLQATTYFIVPRLFCGATAAVAASGWLDEVHMWRVTPKDRCLAYRSAVQSIANNTETAVAWDLEDHDVGPLHDLVTNNNRITVVDGGYGRMELTAQVQWPNNATGYRRIRIKKNGTTIIAEDTRGGTPTIETTQQCTGVDQRPAVGDYYEVLVTQTSGGALNVNAGRPASWFAAQHIY